MPRVGGRHFGYDKMGMKKAKAYAKKTGKPVRKKKRSPKGPSMY